MVQLRTESRADVVRRAVGRVTATLHGMGAGDVAELRRLRSDDVGGAAYWKLVVGVLAPEFEWPDEGSWRHEQESRWSVILSALARLNGLHDTRRGLGHALRSADVSQLRFLRLMRARDSRLHDLIRTTTHQLAAARQTVDIADIAMLVLSDGQRDEEAVRRRLARQYFGVRRDPDGGSLTDQDEGDR